MTDTSVRLALPLLAAGQAQKELFHNEALATLDALVLPAFAAPQDTPPATPGEGSGWIVGTSPTDAWTGQPDRLAIRLGGGWRFIAPGVGMVVQLGDGRIARWDATIWSLGVISASSIVVAGLQVVGVRQPAIVAPSGGTTIDTESRTALAAILAALRGHGLIAT